MTNEKQVYNDLGTFVSVERIERAGKPYFTISFSPTSGPMAGKTMQRGGFASALKNSIDTIKSLREGDDVTLLVTLNKVGDKTYRNLVGVETGHIKQASAPKKSFTPRSQGTNENYGKTYKNDYNDRAAKGQALNLAMQVAIAEGKVGDDNYILSLVPRMLALGEAVQSGATSITATEVTSKVTSKSPVSTNKVGGISTITQADNIVEEIGMDDDIFADLDL